MTLLLSLEGHGLTKARELWNSIALKLSSPHPGRHVVSNQEVRDIFVRHHLDPPIGAAADSPLGFTARKRAANCSTRVRTGTACWRHGMHSCAYGRRHDALRSCGIQARSDAPTCSNIGM